MVGSTVVNQANETVGTIDDLIVTSGGHAPYAVLSVGGFLGTGTKYVVVPFTNWKVVDRKMVLPGGTKDALKALPDFTVSTRPDSKWGERLSPRVFLGSPKRA